MKHSSVLLASSEIEPYVRQFHIFGHGIANGVPEDVHLQRMLKETEGQMGLLISENSEPVALATLVPGIVEDSHFPGAGLICVYLAGRLGVSGVRYLHRCLRQLAADNGGSWYCVSSRVSTYEYRNRYYMIGEHP